MWYNIVAEMKEGEKMQRESSHNSSRQLSKYADYRRRRDSAVDGSVTLVKMILDDRASKEQSLDYGDIYSEAYRWYRGIRYEDVKTIFKIATDHLLSKDSRFQKLGDCIRYIGPSPSPTNQGSAEGHVGLEQMKKAKDLCNILINFTIRNNKIPLDDAFRALQAGCKVVGYQYNQEAVVSYLKGKTEVIEIDGQKMLKPKDYEILPVGEAKSAEKIINQKLYESVICQKKKVENKYTDADIPNKSEKISILQVALDRIVALQNQIPVELLWAYYTRCCLGMKIESNQHEYQELLTSLLASKDYCTPIKHTYIEGERNDYSVDVEGKSLIVMAGERHIIYLSQPYRLACMRAFDRLIDGLKNVVELINSLYLSRVYSKSTLKKYCIDRLKMSSDLAGDVLSVLFQNEASSEGLMIMDKQRFKKIADLSILVEPTEKRSSANTELMDRLEAELSKKNGERDLKEENERLRKENKLLREKIRKYEASKKFPRAVNDYAEEFVKVHNQLANRHVPVIYALAGKLYTTHCMGLKIGRATNIDSRLTLYERTLAQPSASNLWSTHTEVQGFALFSADDFVNGLTVAYINSHIKDVWYPVEAIFRVLFQLEFTKYNVRGEDGRLREWFDFANDDDLFRRAKKLFDLISKTISQTDSWAGKTPSQLRTEIKQCETVEQWLSSQAFAEKMMLQW